MSDNGSIHELCVLYTGTSTIEQPEERRIAEELFESELEDFVQGTISGDVEIGEQERMLKKALANFLKVKKEHSECCLDADEMKELNEFEAVPPEGASAQERYADLQASSEKANAIEQKMATLKATYVSMLRLLVKGIAKRAAADKDENCVEKKNQTEEIPVEKEIETPTTPVKIRKVTFSGH